MSVRVAIIALPPVSMSGIAPVLDALALANEIDGRRLFDPRVYSRDGRAVTLSGGAQLPAEAFDDDVRCDWLIVVAERLDAFDGQRHFVSTLARVAASASLVCGVHHDVWWLAKAGLLAHRRVAAHWKTSQSFVERYGDAIVSQQIFEIDRDRATCASGQAALDFMLTLIARNQSAELAERIADGSVPARSARARNGSACRSYRCPVRQAWRANEASRIRVLRTRWR